MSLNASSGHVQGNLYYSFLLKAKEECKLFSYHTVVAGIKGFILNKRMAKKGLKLPAVLVLGWDGDCASPREIKTYFTGAGP